MWGYDWSGVKPDVAAIAKGMGGGFPIGAFMATEKAAVGMVPGTHGSTYGGNPLATGVANAVLDDHPEARASSTASASAASTSRASSKAW